MDLQELLSAINESEQMAKEIKASFKLDPEDPLYNRRAIFVASSVKLAEQARALKLLASSDLYEEAVGLTRVMVEVAINAIYLQFADDLEVDAFLRFDTLKLSSFQTDKAVLKGDLTSAEQNRSSAAVISHEIRRTPKDLSWCKRSLAKRAAIIDELNPLKIFASLQENSGMLGNLCLHGSFMSMMHLIPGAQAEWPHRQQFCEQAVHLAFNALRGFATLAETFFEPTNS